MLVIFKLNTSFVNGGGNFCDKEHENSNNFDGSRLPELLDGLVESRE